MQISMTIRARLTLLSVLAVLATSLLIGLFFLSNRANEKALAEVFEENSQSLVRMQRMELLLSDVRFRAAGVLLDQMPVQGARNHLKEARGELAELWRTLQAGAGALFGSEDTREAFATLQKGWPRVDQVLAELETGYQSGDNDAITVVLEEQWAPLISGVVKPLQALIPLAQQRSASAYDEARAQSSTMLVTGMAVTGVLLACLIAVAVWTVRSILQPLNDVRRALQRVAEGDLAAPVPPARRDELGPMVAALSTMQAALQHLVTQVRAASDSIATASAEVAMGNADLSQRTEEAASSLQETVASMEQLGGAVSQSADTARQADAMAGNAAQVASAGGAMVSDIVHTMQEIESSSRQISEIIGVIDGIAFQTNILALNAAVEAARAGEQGRGFAVVAGEVRNLASRSAEAARQIRGLIGTSVEKVQTGSALVTRAGGTMNDVVSSVQRVAQMIGEISNAGGEQTHGIAQVNTAVNQLDRMTQQNAALVEQSSAASESLKQQARQLAELVSVFKLTHTA